MALFLLFALFPPEKYEGTIYIHGCHWNDKVVDMHLNGLQILEQKVLKCDPTLSITYSRFHCRWDPKTKMMIITSFFGGQKYRVKSVEPQIEIVLVVDGKSYRKSLHFTNGPTIVVTYWPKLEFQQLTWPMVFD